MWEQGQSYKDGTRIFGISAKGFFKMQKMFPRFRRDE